MAKFQKGDKLIYFGQIPYILADEQKVDSNTREVTILKDLHLDESLFKLVEESKPEFEEEIDKLHELALVENKVFDANKKKEQNKKGDK